MTSPFPTRLQHIRAVAARWWRAVGEALLRPASEEVLRLDGEEVAQRLQDCR